MKKIFVFLALLLFVITGCATNRLYEGEARTDSEVARIAGMDALSPSNLGISAKIIEINGKPVEGSQSDIELLPGTYTLKMICGQYGLEEEPVIVKQEFKAGDRYLLGILFDPKTRKRTPALLLDTNVNAQKK